MAWLAETALSHDKRHDRRVPARHLRRRKKQRDGDEFAGGERDDDEELQLEKALPQPEHELVGRCRGSAIRRRRSTPTETAKSTASRLAEVAPPRSRAARMLRGPRPGPSEEADRLPEPPTVTAARRRNAKSA